MIIPFMKSWVVQRFYRIKKKILFIFHIPISFSSLSKLAGLRVPNKNEIHNYITLSSCLNTRWYIQSWFNSLEIYKYLYKWSSVLTYTLSILLTQTWAPHHLQLPFYWVENWTSMYEFEYCKDPKNTTGNQKLLVYQQKKNKKKKLTLNWCCGNSKLITVFVKFT